jgi:hypothetical protein
MWMPNKNGGECPAESSLAETQPTLRNAFRHVYGFILQALRGDKAAADAIFENYLSGKLSEELLSISRRCISLDQAGSSKREVENLVEIEKWMVGQQQYNRPFAHFGLFNGRDPRTCFAMREDIVSHSADHSPDDH